MEMPKKISCEELGEPCRICPLLDFDCDKESYNKGRQDALDWIENKLESLYNKEDKARSLIGLLSDIKVDRL